MLFGDPLKGEMMSPRALRLLHPWSLYLEKDGDRFSGNNEISMRCLQLGIHLLQLRHSQGTMESHDDMLISQQVNAAFRLGLYFSGVKGNDLIWNFLAQDALDSQLHLWSHSVSEWYTQDHCNLLLDYLLHTLKGKDYTLIGNTYIVLGSLCRSPSPEGKNVYIEALIHSMGSEMPIHVRHAALYAACMVQTQLLSMTPDNGTLYVHFSQALCSVAQLLSSNATIFQYKEWDLCYLKLLCTLSQNPLSHDHLKQHGHFDRCLTIAQTLLAQRDYMEYRLDFAAYGAYIAHLFATEDSYSAFSEPGFSQAVEVYRSWPFTLEALWYIFRFTFFVKPNRRNWEVLSSTGYHEALPHLVRYEKTWEKKEETQEMLIRLINQVSILLKTNPIGNTEIEDLGLEIRRLLYASIKAMGMAII